MAEEVSLPRSSVAKVAKEFLPAGTTLTKESCDLLVACCSGAALSLVTPPPPPTHTPRTPEQLPLTWWTSRPGRVRQSGHVGGKQPHQVRAQAGPRRPGPSRAGARLLRPCGQKSGGREQQGEALDPADRSRRLAACSAQAPKKKKIKRAESGLSPEELLAEQNRLIASAKAWNAGKKQ